MERSTRCHTGGVSNNPYLSKIGLIAFAKDAREKAEQLPSGVVRDDLLKKARQADTASHLDEWINSPGLQPHR